MENLKKNPLSLQLNVEDFAPASNDEKKSLVVMRESVNFWKDGMRRLRKNKIAMVSLVVILLIAFMAYVLPSFWPYSYEQQIKGSNDGKYSNPEFDAAIEASKVADKSVHFQKLHEAEDILMEDAGAIPVAYYTDFWLQSPSLKGTWHSPYGYWYLQYGYVAE